MSAVLTSLAMAQLPAPNTTGVGMGHLHVIGKDLDAHAKFWVEAMGGTPLNKGKMGVYKFPDVIVLVTKGDPKTGSVGTIINHLGFKVKDVNAAVARVKGKGFQIVSENPVTHQAMILSPDDVKIELSEDKSLSAPITHHHIHFYNDAVNETKAWYVKQFGAIPGMRAKFEAADIPGANLTFSKSDTPVIGTKGSSIDHIGFEIKGLEAFMKKLEADGVKINMPYRNVPSLGIAIGFITDPWGTYIELTEGLNKW